MQCAKNLMGFQRLHYRSCCVVVLCQAMVLLQQAIGSREVGRSHVNSESSRSHMVVRFLVGRFRVFFTQVKEVKTVCEGRGMVGSRPQRLKRLEGFMPKV